MSVVRQIRNLLSIKDGILTHSRIGPESREPHSIQIEGSRTEAPRSATLTRIARAPEIPIESLIIRQESCPTGEPEGRGQFGRTIPSRGPREAPTREVALDRKFRKLLDSPLGTGLAQLVHQVYTLIDPRRPVADQATFRAR